MDGIHPGVGDNNGNDGKKRGRAKNPQKEFEALRKELELFNENLVKRPGIFVFSKIDIVQPEKNSIEITMPVVEISSVTGKGLKKLKDCIWRELEKIKEEGTHS